MFFAMAKRNNSIKTADKKTSERNADLIKGILSSKAPKVEPPKEEKILETPQPETPEPEKQEETPVSPETESGVGESVTDSAPAAEEETAEVAPEEVQKDPEPFAFDAAKEFKVWCASTEGYDCTDPRIPRDSTRLAGVLEDRLQVAYRAGAAKAIAYLHGFRS